MEWPQITVIAWYFLCIGFALAKHGQPRTGKISFWTALIYAAILFAVLRAGGFFA